MEKCLRLPNFPLHPLIFCKDLGFRDLNPGRYSSSGCLRVHKASPSTRGRRDVWIKAYGEGSLNPLTLNVES